MVIILDEAELVDELLTGFLDIGVPGATIIDSRGMGSIIRKDMPIFAGLASLFPEHTGSRMVMSVVNDQTAEKVFELVEELVGQTDTAHSAICFTLPVDEFRSIRSKSK
jgi:nitrogen regulatory protein PII